VLPVREFLEGSESVEPLKSDNGRDIQGEQEGEEFDKRSVFGDVLYPDEGEAVFYGQDFQEELFNFRLPDFDVRVQGDHGFVGVVKDCQEFRGIDIAIDEEYFVRIFDCEGIELIPFGGRAIKVIADCDSYY
jgi:hypothetical protein